MGVGTGPCPDCGGEASMYDIDIHGCCCHCEQERAGLLLESTKAQRKEIVRKDRKIEELETYVATLVSDINHLAARLTTEKLCLVFYDGKWFRMDVSCCDTSHGTTLLELIKSL